MHYHYLLVCIMLLVFVSPCEAEAFLKLDSPDLQYSLVITGKLSPESGDVVRTSFSIADARGKVVKELGSTEYPVVAVKWHKSARVVMVIEHISRQIVMRLITLRNGNEWSMLDVKQFKDPPNYFNLVSAESIENGFLCYYLGRSERGGASVGYRTEVNVQTGESRLVSAKPIDDEDLGFYKPSIARGLRGVIQAMEHGGARYSSAMTDDEPDWFVPKKSDNP